MLKKISIISPCYNEEKSLPLFFIEIEKLTKLLKKKACLEFIVVDDYSKDRSVQLLKNYKKKNKSLRLITNPRNYGVYKASYIGNSYATGELIVPMFPVDLQDPPDVLYKMIMLKLKSIKTGIFGRKIYREESFLLNNARNFFYYVLEKFSKNIVNKNTGEFGIVDRWVIDSCLKRNDYYPYLRAMISNITSDLDFVDYVWKKRLSGKSNFNFFDLYDHAINAFLSSGTKFFRPLIFLGFLVSLFAVFFSFLNIFLYLFDQRLFETKGIASLLTLISLFSGFVITFLGLLGEYVLAIHSQIRGINSVSKQKDWEVDE
jgi:glycosyltransferase involved in cell wall biosynthesis